MADANELIVQGSVPFLSEFVVRCLHHSFRIFWTDTQPCQLIDRQLLDVLDVHEANEASNTKYVSVHREAEDLTHQFVFETPSTILRDRSRQHFCFRFGQRSHVAHGWSFRDVCCRRTPRLTWRRPETVALNSDVIRRSRSTVWYASHGV